MSAFKLVFNQYEMILNLLFLTIIRIGYYLIYVWMDLTLIDLINQIFSSFRCQYYFIRCHLIKCLTFRGHENYYLFKIQLLLIFVVFSMFFMHLAYFYIFIWFFNSSKSFNVFITFKDSKVF